MDSCTRASCSRPWSDKRVNFDSVYYDPTDTEVPKYIRLLFEKGAPADFVLIGATTRPPEAISAALRSRCSAVYFEPLTPLEIEKIVHSSAARLNLAIEPEAARLVSGCTCEGRRAVSLLIDAYGRALYEDRYRSKGERQLVVTAALMQKVLASNRYFPLNPVWTGDRTETGRVLALGVSDYTGQVLEIEALAFPAARSGRGDPFQRNSGPDGRDSVFVAASLLRSLTGVDIKDFDLHLNVVGGGNIDGPSAGAAIFLAILSAVKKIPLRQDCAVTGEISLRGQLKTVGGITEKIYGARLAGLKKVVIPPGNGAGTGRRFPDIKIATAGEVGDLLPHFMESGALRQLQIK